MAVYLQHATHLRGASISVHHANRIAPWTEKYTASQARECAAHVVKDMTGHYAPSTINRSLACLKKGLSLTWEQNLTPENYGLRIKPLPVNNKREVFLSVEQVHQLASHCTPQVQAAIWAALLTGARRGELLKLKEEDIGENEIVLQASNTKTQRRRVIPIVPALRPWLTYFPLTITFEGLKSAWQRARKAENMEHVNFHDLRHSCASILLACGVDLYTIGKLLGHANTQTTQRYAHLQIEQQRTALDKLSQLVVNR
jgi:integrase